MNGDDRPEHTPHTTQLRGVTRLGRAGRSVTGVPDVHVLYLIAETNISTMNSWRVSLVLKCIHGHWG